MACPAAAGLPLAARNDALLVCPGTLTEAAMTERLAFADSVAIIKVGRHLARIRRVLDAAGLLEHAWYVAHATMGRQVVMPLAAVTDTTGPYFSMILVHRRGRGMAMTLPAGAAVICLAASGLPTARRIAGSLPGARVHGLAHRVGDADVAFTATVDHVAGLFAAGVPVIGVCATGILIRAVAPLLADKTNEPPLLAVTEDGASVIPLLGGHRGANRLARHLAAVTGGHAVTTTLGDVRHSRALDEMPCGWRLAAASRTAPVMAAVAAGETVRLSVEAGDGTWLGETGLVACDDGRLEVCVTDRADRSADLVMHPPVLAVGVGCERGCDAGELISLVLETLAAAGLAQQAVACIASLDLKSDEPAMLALAERLDVPLVVFPPERLEEERPRLRHPSDIVHAVTGCHGVAEGAALAVAGEAGDLVVEKTRSRRATCAVARSPGRH